MDEIVAAPAWDIAAVEMATADTIRSLDASRIDGHYVIATLRVTNRLDVANAFPLNQLRLVLSTGDRHLPLGFDSVVYALTRVAKYLGGASSISPPLTSAPIQPDDTTDVTVVFGRQLDRGEYWIGSAPSDDLGVYWSVVPWSIYLGEVTTSPLTNALQRRDWCHGIPAVLGALDAYEWCGIR